MMAIVVATGRPRVCAAPSVPAVTVPAGAPTAILIVEWIAAIAFDDAALLEGPAGRIVAEPLGRRHAGAGDDGCKSQWDQTNSFHVALLSCVEWQRSRARSVSQLAP